MGKLLLFPRIVGPISASEACQSGQITVRVARLRPWDALEAKV
jgi:hypothetical protein